MRQTHGNYINWLPKQTDNIHDMTNMAKPGDQSPLRRTTGVLGMHCLEISKNQEFLEGIYDHIQKHSKTGIDKAKLSEFAWAIASTLHKVYNLNATSDAATMCLIQWDLYFALTGLKAQQDTELSKLYDEAINGTKRN